MMNPKSMFVYAAALVLVLAGPGVGSSLIGTAWAAEDGHSGGPPEGHGGNHGGGHDDGHGGGHEDGHGDDGHGDDGHAGGHGGQGGGSHSGGGGGAHAVESGVLRGNRPPWAGGNLPEVELGRLNVSRAPSHVLDRAASEAVAEFDPAMANLYAMDAEAAAGQLSSHYGDTPRVDSPVQNLAMYRDLMTFGETALPGVTPASQLDLAAIFLGSAADKTIPITEDTVTAVNTILGLQPMSQEDTAALATKAEAVRVGIAGGHDSAAPH